MYGDEKRIKKIYEINTCQKNYLTFDKDFVLGI